jgi:shikimate dehydrogenase
VKPFLCGLIGAGIQRSRSPALHEAEARAQGLELVYKLLDLDAMGLGVDALPGLLRDAAREGYRGLNITFPCKQAVMPLLDRLSDEARAIGAVNTVVIDGGKLTGHNTDGSGWSWGFRRALPRADLSRVVLLGAGGAGSACADAVLRLGAEQLVVFDRDAPRAAALAKRLNEHFAGGCAGASADLRAALKAASGLIHATPTGMAQMPGMPLPKEWLQRTMWVSEVVYTPLDTPLLEAARQIGCATMDGGTMNVGQALGGFKLFTGRDADAARMDAHFRKLVSA